MSYSKKCYALYNSNNRLDVLEGQTHSGKTTFGADIKFMSAVSKSARRDHLIAAQTVGVAEKNIINSEAGLLAEWGSRLTYNGNGTADVGLPHLIFTDLSGKQKIIYLVGHNDKSRWEKVLGGQVGCAFVDEANLADEAFLDELSIRTDYRLFTLNPDTPDLPIYKKYINRARPDPRFIKDYPRELLDELNEPAEAGSVHWYFTFDDNPALTAEKKAQIIAGAPKDSKVYKNKILGLRGRAEGLCFDAFSQKNIIDVAEVYKRSREDYRGDDKIVFVKFSCGVDTSYSSKSNDMIAFVFEGYTIDKKRYRLDEEVINNKTLTEGGRQPLAPSDTVRRLVAFLDKNKSAWGYCRSAFLDNADAATMKEWEKFKRSAPCIYSVVPSYKHVLTVLDRITTENAWMWRGEYFVAAHCKTSIDEYNSYSWSDKDGVPLDKNDHTINAGQYAYLPFLNLIGS